MFNQYAALGVVFSPNAFSGPNSNIFGWVTNTAMTVTGTDFGAGGLGAPSLISSKVLHSATGWALEYGDASMRASFSTPVSAVSMDFAGVSLPADTRLWAYIGATLLGSVAGTACANSPCQFTLGFAAPSITSVVFAPGNCDDWVAVDNFSCTQAVPEASTWAQMTLGMVTLACERRRT